MADDWIKMRTDLYRDPKVCVIADLLMAPDSALSGYVNQNLQRDMTITRNVMRNVTVGALVSVWGVLRHRGKRVDDDLVVRGCYVDVIDDIADLPGFGAAMASIGWAVETDEGLVLPNFFSDFNIDPADETKRKNAERQRRFREKNRDKNNGNSNVTVTSQSNAREEKSRDIKPLSLEHALCDDVVVGPFPDIKKLPQWLNDKIRLSGVTQKYIDHDWPIVASLLQEKPDHLTAKGWAAKIVTTIVRGYRNGYGTQNEGKIHAGQRQASNSTTSVVDELNRIGREDVEQHGFTETLDR